MECVKIVRRFTVEDLLSCKFQLHSVRQERTFRVTSWGEESWGRGSEASWDPATFCRRNLIHLSGPHLHGYHGLFRPDRWEKVLLTQEVERKLDQEASDLLKFLLSFQRILFIQTGLRQKSFQLQDRPHVARWQTAEHLQRRKHERSSCQENICLNINIL